MEFPNRNHGVKTEATDVDSHILELRQKAVDEEVLREAASHCRSGQGISRCSSMSLGTGRH